MACLRLIMMALLASAPAMAQPIIIPLQPQPKDEKTPGPVASAPPVAPPIAQPSVPETGVARGENAGQQEEAYQPDDKKPR